MAMLMLCQGNGEACDCYIAGKRAESLPCGGCNYCRNVEEQWERFTNEVDYVVPLTTRRVVQPEQPEPDCNWMESYNMRVAQAEDKEAQLLIRWLDEEKPAYSELRLMDPAMRCYYSCIQQFRMVKGVFYYEWLDDFGSRSLRLFAPRSLRRKIIEGCHDLPSSGHHGEKKTLERVKRSFYWYSLTADVLHYVVTCALCGATKKFSRKSRAALQSYVCGAPLDRLHLDLFGPFHASVNNNKYILVITEQFTKWDDPLQFKIKPVKRPLRSLWRRSLHDLLPMRFTQTRAGIFRAICLRQSANCLGSHKPEPPFTIRIQMVKLNVSTGLYYK